MMVDGSTWRGPGSPPVIARYLRWACALGGVLLSGVTPVVCGQTHHLKAEQQKNLGVAYLEEGRTEDAVLAFEQVVKLVPAESLGHANLGVARLRLGEMDAAAHHLEEARQRDADNVEVLLLVAEAELARRNWQGVVAASRRVLQLDPDSLMARYYIYRAASGDRDHPQAARAASEAIDQLFQLARDNLVVAITYCRRQAVEANRPALEQGLEQIRLSVLDVARAEQTWEEIRKALAGGQWPVVRRSLTELENLLRPTVRFRRDLQDLQPPVAGLPLTRFSDTFLAKLERERPAELLLSWQSFPIETLAPPAWPMTTASAGCLELVDIDGDGRDDVLVGLSDGKRGGVQLWRSRLGDWSATLCALISEPVLQTRLVDFQNADRFDMVLVGPQRLRVLRGDANFGWHDVTASLGLSSDPGLAIEVIDADNEGDLDLFVAGSQQAQMWQQRPDGSFRDASETSGVRGIGPAARAVVALDHDDDLDTDLLVLDQQGRLRLWDNVRHGVFREKPCGLMEERCRMVLPRDFDNDGHEDLMVLCSQGQLWFQKNLGSRFQGPVQIPLNGFSADAVAEGDFDNDGWLDVALAGRRADERAVWLARNRGDGTWALTEVAALDDDCLALAATDWDRDGDLDLIVLDRQGRLRLWENRTGNQHHWMRVRLRGLRVAGSKNNVHGIGSKIELKSGADYQMRTVRRPVEHFGLGQRTEADLLRVVWNNGVPQNRFRPVADQTIREPQVLKGSCPYLYSWNGSQFVFVTDTLAAAPLGLQVAEGVVAPDNPRELLTIPRHKIAPREGEFVFQYTSELWETVYLDEVALWVVDHPSGTEVFTDQRFLPPPYASPAPILTRDRMVPHRAWDTQGNDVTQQVLEFDYRYPQRLEATRFQGVVAPHSLTLEFGDIGAFEHPLLVLGCWIFWTDTSINVALSQSPSAGPSPPVVEVWHPDSSWRTLDRPFGLPNGKDKWVVLDLADELFRADARIRLRSEHQIYWDQAFLANRQTDEAVRITRLHPAAADLHFGGFSRLYRPAPDGPHLYDYQHRSPLPVWMDMTGNVTRYGDVTELLCASDDRFVIFTAGDEVTLRFDATRLPPLAPGYERSYLFYSDGWEKDADRNTITGETVEPLPFHGMSSYPYGPAESYPDSELHRSYRMQYNTRRIGPDAFRRFVRDFQLDDYCDAPPDLPWETEPGVRGDHVP